MTANRILLAAAMFVAIVPAALLACSSCPPGQHVVHSGVFGLSSTCEDDLPDGATRTPSACDMACSAMKDVGCVEGRDARCTSTCENVVDAGLTPINTTCLLQARDAAAVRRCGQPCGGMQ